MAAANLLEPWANPPNIFSGAPVQAFMAQMQAAQNWRPQRQQQPAQSEGVPRSLLATYAGPRSGTASAQPSVAVNSAPSSDRVSFGRQVYDYFVGRGLQPHQAAAVAGNMAWEGGGRTDLVNPGDNTRNSPNAPHSIGVAQWNDRSPALIAFARSQGIDIPHGDLRDANYARDVIARIPLQTQLDFAWSEMQGPERRAYTALTAAPDLRAATAGAIGYHRPAGFTWANPYAGHGFGEREGLARRILGY